MSDGCRVCMNSPAGCRNCSGYQYRCDPCHPNPNCCRRCYEAYRHQRQMDDRMQHMMDEMQRLSVIMPPIIIQDNLQLTEGTEPKEENAMGNVVARIKNLGLSKEDKLLRKYQMVDSTGDLTTSGKEAMWAILLEANKSSLVEKLKELEATEKSKK